MAETITRDGDLELRDFDVFDKDPVRTDRVYCITYVGGQNGDERDLMLFWRRGGIIRSRSLSGGPSGYGRSVADIASFARLAMEAHRLLGD